MFAPTAGLPVPAIPTIRAERLILITGRTACWQCEASTRVSAVLLDRYEERDPEDEDWSPGLDRAMLGRITEINEPAQAQLSTRAPWLKAGLSQTVGAVYLGNHCERCDALQGHWFLTQPGAVFFPLDDSGPELEATALHGPLEAVGELSVSSWMDEIVI